MPEASDLDVAYVARLARLNLTDEETRLFQKQLGDVLKYAAKLGEVDVSSVEAAAHAAPIFNVFREDEPRDWFTAEEALSNAPHKAICNPGFVAGKFPREMFSTLCARALKMSIPKSTLTFRSISMRRRRKRKRPMSIFHSAVYRLRSKTSLTSPVSPARARRKFCTTIARLTTRP